MTGDLDFDRSMIHIREGKRRKDRYVPFSRNMQKVVAVYMKSYTPHLYLFEQEPDKPKGKDWPSKSSVPEAGRDSDDTVTFTYKDYADGGKNKEMTLDGDEFVRRYTMHVLPERFVRIRHFGYLAPGNRETLGALQVELGSMPVPRHRKRKSWQTICTINLHYSYSFLLQELTGSTSAWCSLFLFESRVHYILN